MFLTWSGRVNTKDINIHKSVKYYTSQLPLERHKSINFKIITYIIRGKYGVAFIFFYFDPDVKDRELCQDNVIVLSRTQGYTCESVCVS